MKMGNVIHVGFVAARNFVVGSNLAALTLVRHPYQMLYYIGECLFLFKTLLNRRKLPQPALGRVLAQVKTEEELRLGNLKGYTWFLENPTLAADIVGLCLLCRAIKPRVIFEIGTQTGYTALHLALNSPDDATVYTLDLPPDRSPDVALKTTLADARERRKKVAVKRPCFEDSSVAHKIACLTGDSAVFDYSPYHGRVDLFFIDGAHSYEYVRSDTSHALECCHSGSFIIWHDYGRVEVGGVERFLHEMKQDGHDVRAIPGGSLAYMTVH
ncbi:class I SAM-dependent methyltransferase [bacterium]|nr:class I SAM-dependent methyltransferase [bacterium]MBU1983653.1 class I SAM-dependent methyltransferase [bacterium]